MEVKSFELSGWIRPEGEYETCSDVFLEKDKPPQGDEYGYYSGDQNSSVGDLVMEEFGKISKSFNPNYTDWTQGDFVSYRDVFVRYYISEVPLTWDEAVELHVRVMAGDLEAQQKYTGYSEYTVTDDWVDLFVGGHDLRKELISHKGKFALVKIDYKV